MNIPNWPTAEAKGLHDAMTFAMRMHNGQVRSTLGGTDDGKPYVIHPIRVMLAAKGWEDQVVAVLHDVLEDTLATRPDLVSLGIPLHLVEAIEVLTRKPGEAYRVFIARCAANPYAARVKVLDIQDNLRSLPAEHGLHRRYAAALEWLGKAAAPKEGVVKPSGDKLEKSIRALVDMAERSDAATAKVLLRDDDEQPVGLLLYVTGPEADMFYRAVEVVEDALARRDSA